MTVDETTVHDLSACLRDLIATIDLHTDCMNGKIDREALEPYIERAEDLLEVRLVGGRCDPYQPVSP